MKFPGVARRFAGRLRALTTVATASQPPPHVPVLLPETLRAWRTPSHGPFSYYVDGTLGAGGHSAALLSSDPTARLLCVDKDRANLEETRLSLTNRFGTSRIAFAHGCFSDLGAHLAAANFPPQVSGILVDLGVSSMQLDNSERGFSFQADGPLDMRMDQGAADTRTASDLVNSLNSSELERLFRDFGDENAAGLAARLIVERRRDHGPFSRTSELANCLLPLGGGRGQGSDAKNRGGGMGKGKGKREKSKNKNKNKNKKRHPATRCFQALRIAVNGELDALASLLGSCARADTNLLRPGGRLAVISFHSLEDRPTKVFFRRLAAKSQDSVEGSEQAPIRWKLLQRKPIIPGDAELLANPRARSARLRAIERICPEKNRHLMAQKPGLIKK